MTRSVSPPPGLDLAARGGARLEHARGRGADRDDAPAARARTRDRGRRGVGERRTARRARCARATSSTWTGRKVPGPTCRTTSARSTPRAAQAREQGRREVQARGRRGHAARLPRVDRLVALAVLRPVRAADVGRQGHVPAALQLRGRVARRRVERGRSRRPSGRGASSRTSTSRPVGDPDAHARRQPPARAHERVPDVVARGPQQEHLRPPAAWPACPGGAPGRRGCG